MFATSYTRKSKALLGRIIFSVSDGIAKVAKLEDV